jgi:hypothetical protein
MASVNISVNDRDLSKVDVSAKYYSADNTDLSIVIDDVRIFITDYAGGKALKMIADEINRVADESILRSAIEAEVFARLNPTEVEA